MASLTPDMQDLSINFLHAFTTSGYHLDTKIHQDPSAQAEPCLLRSDLLRHSFGSPDAPLTQSLKELVSAASLQ